MSDNSRPRTAVTDSDRDPGESDSDFLRRRTSPEGLNVGLVSAYSGDRDLSDVELLRVRTLAESRGKSFYSDLLYTLTHHYFPPELAEGLWRELLEHKNTMSRCLGRNVRITVAALDFLSNITQSLDSPALISEAYIAQLAQMSMKDRMTGLCNHSVCYELLDNELVRNRRHGGQVGFILIDIDDFKRVNDNLGHQAGDRLLVQLARTLENSVRESDICCRFGGEEFAVILPLTESYLEACEVAERIRSRIHRIAVDGRHITVSGGVAVASPVTATPQDVVELADRALYVAKRKGKNRIVAGRDLT